MLDRNAYELRAPGRLLGRLEGGADSLLSGSGEPLRALDMETAIERAEDWIMPLVGASEEKLLRVVDRGGHVHTALGDADRFSPADVELAFSRAFDTLAFGRPIARTFVADLVVLREVVHHANAKWIAFG